jgi:hypothetical protein
VLEIGLPAAKIVIDINARNPRGLGAAFQGRKFFGHEEGLFEQGLAVGKGEIINDINEEQGYRGRIRGTAMSIVLLAWHPALLTPETKGRHIAPVCWGPRGRMLPVVSLLFWQEATPLSTAGADSSVLLRESRGEEEKTGREG